MNNPKQLSDFPSSDEQDAIYQKLGRCILRLQQYELLLKHVLPYTTLSGHPAQMSSLLAQRRNFLRKETMGGLVTLMSNTFLASADSAESSQEIEPAGDNRLSLRKKIQVVYSQGQYDSIKRSLKELVLLRNSLVHDFANRFDLNSPEGCLAAEEFLDESYENIDENFAKLRGWAQTADYAEEVIASVFNSASIGNFLSDGIGPDGTVYWPMSGIVVALRDAQAQLSVNGWTSLTVAIAWIKEHAPEQYPKRYGCKSWLQILKKSNEFDIRKQLPPLDVEDVILKGSRIWFKDKKIR